MLCSARAHARVCFDVCVTCIPPPPPRRPSPSEAFRPCHCRAAARAPGTSHLTLARGAASGRAGSGLSSLFRLSSCAGERRRWKEIAALWPLSSFFPKQFFLLSFFCVQPLALHAALPDLISAAFTFTAFSCDCITLCTDCTSPRTQLISRLFSSPSRGRPLTLALSLALSHSITHALSRSRSRLLSRSLARVCSTAHRAARVPPAPGGMRWWLSADLWLHHSETRRPGMRPTRERFIEYGWSLFSGGSVATEGDRAML